MPSRERWIVYPLLFMALGLAMRPSLVSTMEVQDIRCRSLTSGKLKTGDAIVQQLKTADANVHHLRLVDNEGRMHGELAAMSDGGNLNLWKYGGPRPEGEALIIAFDSQNRPVRLGEVRRRPKLPEPPTAEEEKPAEAEKKAPARNEK